MPLLNNPDSPPADFEAHQQGLLRRIDHAQAQAAQDYQEGRDALADHHGKMEAQAETLRGKIEKLGPRVDELLNKPGTPLDAKRAQQCLEYLRLCAQLHETLTASRYGAGAAGPAKEAWEPGQPIGDPPPLTPAAQVENPA